MDNPCDDGIFARLWLPANKLNGTIPDEIYIGLPSLTSIDLNSNLDVSGTISSQIHKLESLRELSLYRTDVFGRIPSELGLVSSLEILYLSKLNQGTSRSLWGSLPSHLGQLTKLRQMTLWGNQISSTLPTEIGTMSNMRLMMIGGNPISGTIPSELGNLSALMGLILENNPGLGGTLPIELGRVNGTLEVLQITETALSGAIPEMLCTVKELEFDCSSALCGCNCTC